MSSDRDITRIIRSWLSEDAHEDADRVLFSVLERLDTTPQHRPFWRGGKLLPMGNPLRIAAVAAAVFAAVVLGIALTRPNVGNPRPSASPSVSPSSDVSVAPSLPALSERFTSAIHGYSISYPAGWTVRPATEPWLTGFAVLDAQAYASENDHFVAHIKDTLAVTSQAIPAGATFDDWLGGYLDSLNRDDGLGCGVTPLSGWADINIGGQRGVWKSGPNCFLHGVAVVAAGGRAYVFAAQTNRTPPFGAGFDVPDPDTYLAPDQFLGMLATVQFDPASAVGAP